MAKTLVMAPEAWSPQPQKFKTPYEFVVSSWRAADIAPQTLPDIGEILNALGQKPFSAPSPKGWPEEAEVWCAPDAVIKRMAWAQGLAAKALNGRDPLAAGQRRARRAADAARRRRHLPGRNARGRPGHPLDVSGVSTPMSDAPTLSALSRRQALAGALGVGITVEFLGRKAFAAGHGASETRKLVVVICRGGMDGLSVSPPVGDPNYASLRGPIAIPGFGQPGGALKLDDTFGLHPALPSVHALALKGEARIAPAVASPDRARSHFEAQDVLENGATAAYGTDSGWLNRALQVMGPGKVKGISVGATAPLILRGSVEAASWSPGPGAGRDTRLPGILADLYANDPMLSRALASGLATEAMAKVANADATAALSQTSSRQPAQARRAPTRRRWAPTWRADRRCNPHCARACPPRGSSARRWPAS